MLVFAWEIWRALFSSCIHFDIRFALLQTFCLVIIIFISFLRYLYIE